MSSSEAPLRFRVASFYQFTRFDDCADIQRMLKQGCSRGGVRGTLILANEGINGTIAGSSEAVEDVVRLIRSQPGCANLVVKDSSANAMPFHRMKVRIKPEIVTMGEPAVSPLHGAGEYVPADQWNALIADPDTIVIDTRNHYEVEVGTFKNAIDPRTKSFRDFPAWFREQRASLTGGKSPKVAMFCTGGIRCEKATALLKAEGIEHVYHLQGGILKYLEEVPKDESMWEGECFVFDQRVCLVHGLEAGSFAICHACRMPMTEADKASPQYEEGVSCPACYQVRNSKQRERYAERHRQTKLAEQRGGQHIGPRQGGG
ncbi:MAG: rhodanese-related sulfurtransferase [Sphingomicrobium sp.]